ncbi:MAG: zinc ribbon domain-containing protein [Eubacteriales bacterium]|nr:zinc ribbon domain-containing protein [Eubacteriales bacterium]
MTKEKYQKKSSKIVAFLFVIVFMLLLGGCGVTKLSGTYVNELDSTEYLKFSGKSKVKLYTQDSTQTGSYRIIDDLLVLSFGDGENATVFLEIENKKTLYYGLVAYVKKNFLQRHWLKILIGTIVVGIIGWIAEKLEDREDVKKWLKQLEALVNGWEEAKKDTVHKDIDPQTSVPPQQAAEPERTIPEPEDEMTVQEPEPEEIVQEPESGTAEQNAQSADADSGQPRMCYCAYCGKRIPATIKFCIYCGEKTFN